MTDKTENAILLRVDPWIFRLNDLTLFEKILLNYVYSWTIQSKCCPSTDGWLAHKFGFTPNDVSTTLTLLEMKGFIRIHKHVDGSRTLSFVFTDLPDPCEGVTSSVDAFKID